MKTLIIIYVLSIIIFGYYFAKMPVYFALGFFIGWLLDRKRGPFRDKGDQ